MAKLNLSKEEIIQAFKEGKKIRLTCGIWNEPNKHGKRAISVEDIERFYSWAYLVDVYNGFNEIIDYDLVGASGGDMF